MIRFLINWIYPPDLWRINIMFILLSCQIFCHGELLRFFSILILEAIITIKKKFSLT